MKPLYIVGTSGSGKTATCLGLAQIFQEAGHTVAYFKPIGNMGDAKSKEDLDSTLMKTVLSMKVPLERMTLFPLSFDYLDKYDGAKSSEYRDSIKVAFKEISQNADIVIIEGTTNPQAMISLGLGSADIALMLGAKGVMVSTLKNDFRMDNLLLHNDYMRTKGVELLGSVLNFVPPDVAEKTEKVYARILEREGFKVLGIVPHAVELTAPTVQEIHDILGGEVLAGEGNVGALVKSFLIGAMTPESAMTYFKKTPDKAVITGGDRTGIALAALDTSTSALILTGDLHPDPRVIAKARERDIATILVPHDTYTTVERLHDISRKIKPDDERSRRLTRELVEQYCDWEKILEGLKD